MNKNVGNLDRTIRAVVGVVALVVGLFFTGGMEGATLGIIITAVGGILVFTSAIGWCPPYALLKLSTLKK